MYTGKIIKWLNEAVLESTNTSIVVTYRQKQLNNDLPKFSNS